MSLDKIAFFFTVSLATQRLRWRCLCRPADRTMPIGEWWRRDDDVYKTDTDYKKGPPSDDEGEGSSMLGEQSQQTQLTRLNEAIADTKRTMIDNVSLELDRANKVKDIHAVSEVILPGLPRSHLSCVSGLE